jgi:hypothetical protein
MQSHAPTSTSLFGMYAYDKVSKVHKSRMHGSKAKGIGCDDYIVHCKLDQCPSSLKKVHSNPKKIGSHRVFSIKMKFVSSYLC